MINSHHMNRYFKIIEFYKFNPQEGYNERHHIVPKCLGGTDDPSNLILLPVRVHFLCHYILHKAHPDNRKLAHAFAMMGVNNPYQKRLNSKLYEKSKIARSHALKGVSRPEWVKEKLRKPKSNRENYKKPKSEIHKEKIKTSLLGRSHPWQHKVFSSEGYQLYRKARIEKKEAAKQFHRDNFIKSGMKRKEYYLLHPELSEVTLKRYLRGL